MPPAAAAARALLECVELGERLGPLVRAEGRAAFAATAVAVAVGGSSVVERGGGSGEELARRARLRDALARAEERGGAARGDVDGRRARAARAAARPRARGEARGIVDASAIAQSVPAYSGDAPAAPAHTPAAPRRSSSRSASSTPPATRQPRKKVWRCARWRSSRRARRPGGGRGGGGRGGGGGGGKVTLHLGEEAPRRAEVAARARR